MRFELDAEDARLVGERTGHGPCVVLLHAGGERRQVWDPVVETLVASGYSCVTLDQRGHGQSGGAREGFDRFLEDGQRLRAYVDQPAVYVGASLGGLVALSVAARNGKDARAQVAALVLVDVVPDPDPERASKVIADGMGAAAARSPLVLEILGRGDELRAMASDIVQPTLLVAGERGLGRAAAERFRTVCPHAEIHEIANCGHLVAREHPAELSRALLSFLARREVQSKLGPAQTLTAFERANAWLLGHGADRIEHLAGSLLEHLRRTELWLDRWNAPEHVRLAGLCHAAYGTDGFETSLIAQRAPLTELIGASAEETVYRYASCARALFYPQLREGRPVMRDRFSGADCALSPEELSDFALLTLANELDVVRHGSLTPSVVGQIRALFEALALHRPEEAALALRVVDRAG